MVARCHHYVGLRVTCLDLPTHISYARSRIASAWFLEDILFRYLGQLLTHYMETEQQEIDRHFPECPNISVDYAILEHSDEIYVFPADFGWSDLGTWGSLHVQMDKDLAGNVAIGPDITLYESRGCVVHTIQEKKVVIIGLDGYIVAENDDRLLICKLEDEQRIKEFSDK